MTFVDIKPGQWVLAFDQPYGPYEESMTEHLEMFAHRSGGWDSHRSNEILHVYEVKTVAPKTYTVGDVVTHDRAYLTKRQERSHVIAAGASKEEMIALRERFFSIGAETTGRIEREAHRRIQKFAVREEAKAVKKIHRLLPHIFGRPA